jgi:hypothetical protein
MYAKMGYGKNVRDVKSGNSYRNFSKRRQALPEPDLYVSTVKE